MKTLAIEPGLNNCRCGALCEANRTRCPKCRARARWYRRKAWRTNSPNPAKSKRRATSEGR